MAVYVTKLIEYLKNCNNKNAILLAFERSFLFILIAANLLKCIGIVVPINITNNVTNKLSSKLVS